MVLTGCNLFLGASVTCREFVAGICEAFETDHRNALCVTRIAGTWQSRLHNDDFPGDSLLRSGQQASAATRELHESLDLTLPQIRL